MENQIKQENLSDARKFLEQTQKNISGVKGAYKFALIIAALIAVVSVGYSFYKTASERELVYVIDNESARYAAMSDNDAQRDLEIVDHVARFHEKFYNLAPNPETIDENIDIALSLADRSAQLMDNRRREQQFYTNLIYNTIVQEIFIDSTVVNTAVRPYRAYTYGKLYLTRSSNVTRYIFESSCRLIETERTTKNPHGLLIEQFKEERVEIDKRGNR